MVRKVAVARKDTGCGRDPQAVAVGKRLAKRRGERGLTQAQLAAAVGVTPSAVGLWEIGAAKPGFDNLNALAGALAVGLDWLIAGGRGAVCAETAHEKAALRLLRAMPDDRRRRDALAVLDRLAARKQGSPGGGS